jgi:hypothetical protein
MIKHLSLAISTIFLLIGMSLYFYPIDNFQVDKDLAYIINKDKIVCRNENVFYEFTYYKPYNIPGVLQKQILMENGYSVIFDPVVGNLEAGTHTTKASLLIPDIKYLEGKAKIVFYIKYDIFGGFRTLYDRYESETFTIKGCNKHEDSTKK